MVKLSRILFLAYFRAFDGSKYKIGDLNCKISEIVVSEMLSLKDIVMWIFSNLKLTYHISNSEQTFLISENVMILI